MTAGPVVVCVLSHRDPPQVRRLVSRLVEGTDTVALVHHDPQGPALELPRHDAVLTVPDPVHCAWGRIDLARATLRLVDLAVERVPELSWMLLISGQDYPCRPMADIEAALQSSQADAYLRWFRVGDPAEDVVPWQAVTRARYLRHRRLPFSRRHVPFPRRPPFRDGVSLFVGDMWPNLGAAAVAHLREQGALRSRIEPYLRWCAIPDEALLPTLLLNGGEHLDVVNDRRRFMRWGTNSAHPDVLTEEDLPAVTAGEGFFARKVDPTVSAGLLDRLDEVAVRR